MADARKSAQPFAIGLRFIFSPFSNVLNHSHDELASGYGSKAKIFFQSSFSTDDCPGVPFSLPP